MAGLKEGRWEMQWGRKEAGYSQPREPWEEHHTASCLEDGEHKTDFVIVVLADSVDCGLSGCCHAGAYAHEESQLPVPLCWSASCL